jgi:hypothetical protein
MMILDKNNAQALSDTSRDTRDKVPVTAVYNKVGDSDEGKIKHQLMFSFK